MKKKTDTKKPAEGPSLPPEEAEKLRFNPDYYFHPTPEGRAKNIAFISDMMTPYVMSVYSGLEQQAYKTDRYSYIISHFTTFNEERAKNTVLAKIIYEKNTDCVIMMTEWPGVGFMAELKKRKVPVIIIEKKIPGAHSITVDNFRGAYMATDYLIKQGRKRIALVRGESGLLAEGETTALVPNERQNGYMAALSDNGIMFDQRLVYYVYHHIKEEGGQIYGKMKRDRADADAVFCAAGDLTAAGLIEEAKKDGAKVPQDIAVIGYDDILRMPGFEGILTTVRQPADEMGAEAFRIAVEAVRGNMKEFKNVVFNPELIVRNTA